MHILVTGAKGFVGRNLVETFKTIRDGKNRTRNLQIEEILNTISIQIPHFCRNFAKRRTLFSTWQE